MVTWPLSFTLFVSKMRGGRVSDFPLLLFLVDVQRVAEMTMSKCLAHRALPSICSTYWLEWDFLKYFQPTMLLAFSHRLCVFPGVSSLNTPGIRLQIFDGFYFLFGKWLKVHQRWYTMTSQLFLEPVLSPTHAHGGLDSQNMLEFFETLSTLIPHIFL